MTHPLFVVSSVYKILQRLRIYNTLIMSNVPMALLINSYNTYSARIPLVSQAQRRYIHIILTSLVKLCEVQLKSVILVNVVYYFYGLETVRC